MAKTDIIILVIRVLSGTIVALSLLASLFVFRTPNENGEPEIPIIAWLPILDSIWALAAPIIHWRKSATGKLCTYGLEVSALIFVATFLIRCKCQRAGPPNPVPSALLAFRLRSSLGCQKQAGCGD